MFDKLFSLVSEDIGIDLGTANTLVFVLGKGIVIRQPSVIAWQRKEEGKEREMIAIGEEAKKMLEKTPPMVEVIKPLKDGVIADFDATCQMLDFYIKKVHQTPGLLPKIPKPKVVLGIPSGVTEVERRAVAEAALSAGARKVFLVEEPMAAAIGASLPIMEPTGQMIIDIGGGTCEIAVLSLGGIVIDHSLRIAGDEMDEAIVQFCRLKHGLFLGLPSAEEAKIAIGSTLPFAKEKQFVIRGRNLETGLPASIKLNSIEVREALAGVIQQIVNAVTDTLEETPPELLADILKNGIVLAGGGALLFGIDKVLSQSTKMPVWVAERPQECVVRGCGKLLEDNKLLEKVKVVGGIR